MNINRLQELKQKLKDEANLSQIWLFYMDHFADHPEFTDLGQPAQNNYLDAVLHKSCQQMFGGTITITNFFLICIPEHHFFHGPFEVKGHIGGVIFCEDIKTGLLALSAQSPPSDQIKYSRFSESRRQSKPNQYNLN
jgi:hypothetical protein